MDIDTHEKKIPKEKPSEIVCTFCMKPTCQDFANIQQKADLLELLKKLNVDILPVNDQIDWICYQCTYKLNCIRDYARTWASCVTKNRINYYYRLGEKEMVRRLLNLKCSKPLRSLSIDGVLDQNVLDSSHNKNELKLKISSVRSIDVNDIPGTLSTITETNKDTKFEEIIEQIIAKNEKIKNEYNIEPKDHIQNKDDNDNNNEHGDDDKEDDNEEDNEVDDNEEDNDNEDDNDEDNENDSDRDTPEQELLSIMYEKSESVLNTESGGHILHYHNNKPNNKPTLLTCKQCYRVYRKLSFLKKHERKHDRDNNKENLKSTIIPPIPTKKETTTIKCKDCECTFTTLATWRNHYQSHQSQLKCSYCPAVFILSTDLEIHEAVCYGVSSAKNKNQPSHRYRTRSSHRTNNIDDDENLTISEVDTMYTKRLDNARDWVNKTGNNSNIKKDIGTEELLNIIDDNDDCKSLATTFTRASSRLTSTYTEAEEDDDDLSTLTRPSAPSKDTLYRLKKRNKETDTLYENAQKRSKISKNFIDKLVKCPDKNCNFITTSIERLHEHDLTVHDELPLFSCKKCNGQFLRHFYLKDHLYLQNPGRFICNQCERVFYFEHELQFHTSRHEIVDNIHKTHYCQFCNLKFVTISDYYHHLETSSHNERNPEVDEKIKPEDFEYEEEEEKVDEKTIETEISVDQKEQKKSPVEQVTLFEQIKSVEDEIAAVEKVIVLKEEKIELQEEKITVAAPAEKENLIEIKDLFKDEKKNLAYIEMMKEDDDVINTTDNKFNFKTHIPIKIDEILISDDDNEIEDNENINIKTEQIIDSSSFKIKMELKDNIEKKLKRVEPYKSEIRIRQFGKPIKRRRLFVFRQVRQHSEPLRKIGTDYLNCAIKPYINLS